MRVRLIAHAKERAAERGTTESEIATVLSQGAEIPAKKDRKAKEMIFKYGKKWLRKFYPEKKVRVIFVEEEKEVILQ